MLLSFFLFSDQFGKRTGHHIVSEPNVSASCLVRAKTEGKFTGRSKKMRKDYLEKDKSNFVI